MNPRKDYDKSVMLSSIFVNELFTGCWPSVTPSVAGFPIFAAGSEGRTARLGRLAVGRWQRWGNPEIGAGTRCGCRAGSVWPDCCVIHIAAAEGGSRRPGCVCLHRGPCRIPQIRRVGGPDRHATAGRHSGASNSRGPGRRGDSPASSRRAGVACGSGRSRSRGALQRDPLLCLGRTASWPLAPPRTRTASPALFARVCSGRGHPSWKRGAPGISPPGGRSDGYPSAWPAVPSPSGVRQVLRGRVVR